MAETAAYLVREKRSSLSPRAPRGKRKTGALRVKVVTRKIRRKIFCGAGKHIYKTVHVIPSPKEARDLQALGEQLVEKMFPSTGGYDSSMITINLQWTAQQCVHCKKRRWHIAIDEL